MFLRSLKKQKTFLTSMVCRVHKENTQYFCTWFLSDLYIKSVRSYVIVKQRGDQKRPEVSWACAVLVLRFSNHSVLHRLQLLYACEQSPKELTAGKETERQRQLLMFGSRNWRSKSRKERNYAPVSQIPGYTTEPILVDLILFSLFLKQSRLGASTVSWSKLFHLLPETR